MEVFLLIQWALGYFAEYLSFPFKTYLRSGLGII